MTQRLERKTVEKTVRVFDEITIFNCDRCGQICTDEDDGFPWVVRFQLYGNPDDCVSMRVMREFCDSCANDVERELMEVLGLRDLPDGESEDRFWGNYKPAYRVERRTATPIT